MISALGDLDVFLTSFKAQRPLRMRCIDTWERGAGDFSDADGNNGCKRRRAESLRSWLAVKKICRLYL